MKTTASALLSALILFHVSASEMVVAQEAAAATTGGHPPLLRALKEGVPEMSFSSGMSMSMPTVYEGIVPPGPSSSSTGGGMADFLPNFKGVNIKLVETLSGKKSVSKVSSGGVDFSDFTSTMDGGGLCDIGVEGCIEGVIQDFDENFNKTCIVYGKSSKSGKSGLKGGSLNSKIKKINVGAFALSDPATIYNRVMHTPQVYIIIKGNDEVAFFTTLIYLLVLESYLACADSKIENLLTVDIYVRGQLDGNDGISFLQDVYDAYTKFRTVRGDVDDLDSYDFPLISFYPLVFDPQMDGGIAIAATAAVY